MLFNIISPILYFTGGISVNVEPGVAVRRGITALTGRNASGKTTFARIIERGRNFRTNRIVEGSPGPINVKYIEFNDIHSFAADKVGYYQQRYEATMNDEVPTVNAVMEPYLDSPLYARWLDALALYGAGQKKINFLSSGELRKLLIVKALMDAPELIILDNPYIGLDIQSRQSLNSMLCLLPQRGISVMLLLSDDGDVPPFVDNRLYARNMTVSTCPDAVTSTSTDTSLIPPTFQFSTELQGKPGDEIISMRNCRIAYGDITVQPAVDWTVLGGERWSLSGPNGSGKSTLLSIICADNPKGYSTPISLFGQRRGTGESIWDIKRRIGYVSPEMQMHFHGSGTVEHIIANGLNDTVGLYVTPTSRQIEAAKAIMAHFGISGLGARLFRTLSSGERQLVLVARAIVKEPLLLILDEPMHALDACNRVRVNDTISRFLLARPDAAFIMVTHNISYLPQQINRHLKLIRHADNTSRNK